MVHENVGRENVKLANTKLLKHNIKKAFHRKIISNSSSSDEIHVEYHLVNFLLNFLLFPWKFVFFLLYPKPLPLPYSWRIFFFLSLKFEDIAAKEES